MNADFADKISFLHLDPPLSDFIRVDPR